jgi:hypothetical protein
VAGIAMRDGKDKISLRGLEVIVPYRGANPDRHRNLRSLLRHFDVTYTDYTVLILEADRETTLDDNITSDKRITHYFLEDGGPFPKASLCNRAVHMTKGAILCFQDVDTIGHPSAVRYCLDDLLDKPDRHCWSPFKQMVNVNGFLRDEFHITGDYGLLDRYSDHDGPLG